MVQCTHKGGGCVPDAEAYEIAPYPWNPRLLRVASDFICSKTGLTASAYFRTGPRSSLYQSVATGLNQLDIDTVFTVYNHVALDNVLDDFYPKSNKEKRERRAGTKNDEINVYSMASQMYKNFPHV